MEMMATCSKLDEMLQFTSALHRHLCPRQVLGVRMGLLAAELLPFEMPQRGKRLLAFIETDGCFSDGVSVATGCSMGHRTMRMVEYGKVAATFVDTREGRAFRVAPLPEVRTRAAAAVPAAKTRWHGQLEAYRILPTEELFSVRPVKLNLDLKGIIGRPGKRATCSECREEILNDRETIRDGRIFCESCAGESYWTLAE